MASHGEGFAFRLFLGVAASLLATGVAASVLLILAHDQPFVGQLSVGPQPLFQVMPELAHSVEVH